MVNVGLRAFLHVEHRAHRALLADILCARAHIHIAEALALIVLDDLLPGFEEISSRSFEVFTFVFEQPLITTSASVLFVATTTMTFTPSPCGSPYILTFVRLPVE
jgi:hypothetical protein